MFLGDIIYKNTNAANISIELGLLEFAVVPDNKIPIIAILERFSFTNFILTSPLIF
jgi:hypothetical protein